MHLVVFKWLMLEWKYKENVLSVLAIGSHFHVIKNCMFNLLKIALTLNFYSYHWSILSLSKFRGETTPQVYIGERPDTLECKNFNWWFGAVRLITLGLTRLIFLNLALYTLTLLFGW